MAGLLAMSTVANIVGTNKIVKNYHFTETRGANLTDANGAMLQCAPPSVGGALAAADGETLATKSADLDTTTGTLTTPEGGHIAVTAATGRVGMLDNGASSGGAPMSADHALRHRSLLQRAYREVSSHPHDPARHQHHHRLLICAKPKI